MLPSVTSLKEFQAQPLIRKIMKSHIETPKKISNNSHEIIHKSSKSSYQQYRKQSNQQATIQVEKLFFRNQPFSSRETPPSFLITHNFERRPEVQESTIKETKYQDKIKFHKGRLLEDQNNSNLIKSFSRFRLQENVCQRQIITSQHSQRIKTTNDQDFRYFVKQNGMKQVVIVNQIYLNTNTLQYIFMYVPDHSVKDKTVFQEFVTVVKNRLKINSKKLYFYLKDGTPVYSHLDIPINQSLLIYSTSTVYKEVFNAQLLHLENCCKKCDCEKFIRRTEPDYSKQVDGIINTLIYQNYQSINEEYQPEKMLEEIEITQEFLTSKELKHSYSEIKRNSNYTPIIKQMSRPSKTIRQKNQFIEYMSTDYIVKNPKVEKLEKIEGWYDQELKKIKFKQEDEENQNEDLMAVHIENISSQKLIESQIQQAAILLDPLLKKILHNKNGSSLDDGPEVNFNNDQKERIKHSTNFIEKNTQSLITKKGSLHKLLNINKELFIQGIPTILKDTNFSRYELHNTYILYCALQQITSQRYQHYSVDDGVDYDTYRTGIYQIFMQSEFLAQEIFNKIDFNYSGFLNWNEFLKLMVSIRAKTLIEKLDLFIQISDQDGNGQLCWEEIFQLSKVCLAKYIQNTDDFLDMLCEYYTRLIFKVVGKEPNEEIPFSDIKQAILDQKEDSDLLCMFCGADI